MEEGGERGEETAVEGEMPLLPTTTATMASTKTKNLAAELGTENGSPRRPSGLPPWTLSTEGLFTA